MLTQVDGHFLHFVAYIGDLDMVKSRWKAEGIETVHVGDRTPVKFTDQYGSSDQFFTGTGILDMAADGIPGACLFFCICVTVIHEKKQKENYQEWFIHFIEWVF
jgi:hypothetical protein